MSHRDILGGFSYNKEETIIKELTGIFRQNQKGFGFVTVEDEEEDYFIEKEDVNGAWNMDTVVIVPKAISFGRAKEARIKKVETRAVSVLVGTFHEEEKKHFVIPDDAKIGHKIVIDKSKINGAVCVPALVGAYVIIRSKSLWSAGNSVAERLKCFASFPPI